jgi:hypothetical protein
MTIAGARGNGARFFEWYFRDNQPIQRATFLAAHIVLMASRLDRQMIDGLDIAIFNAEGYRLLNEQEKEVLRVKSAALDAAIRAGLEAPLI